MLLTLTCLIWTLWFPHRDMLQGFKPLFPLPFIFPVSWVTLKRKQLYYHFAPKTRKGKAFFFSPLTACCVLRPGTFLTIYLNKIIWRDHFYLLSIAPFHFPPLREVHFYIYSYSSAYSSYSLCLCSLSSHYFIDQSYKSLCGTWLTPDNCLQSIAVHYPIPQMIFLIFLLQSLSWNPDVYTWTWHSKHSNRIPEIIPNRNNPNQNFCSV